MNAYIDYNNFCSYLKAQGHQDWNDCNTMLMRNLNLFFTFDKLKLAQSKKEVKMRADAWLTKATQGRKNLKMVWNDGTVPEPLPERFHETSDFDRLTSVYLLDREGAQALADKGLLLVGTVGKELETLKNLGIVTEVGETPEFVPTRQFRIRAMTDWSVVGANASPCTDIIIVDQYIFAQSDTEYDINSYALIEQLCKNAHDTVNIVLFTFNNYDDAGQRMQIPITTIIRNLKEKIRQSTGHEPNVTIAILPSQAQHDRTILTNYKLITSGDSFKYFRGGANVALCSHGEWLYVNSHYDKKNLEGSQAFLTDMQAVVDTIKGGIATVYGDRKCNFLNFS